MRTSKSRPARGRQFPVIVQIGVDGFYVVECPLLEGCYSQGSSIDEALRNIREAIELVMEEKGAKATLDMRGPLEISLHTIAV